MKLNLDVMQDNEKGDSVEVIANDHPIPTAPNEDYIGNIWASEKRGDDPYAATRRAIVRAAAEIGSEISEYGAVNLGKSEEADNGGGDDDN